MHKTFLGIDLGTTFSAIATVDSTGNPIILENSEGDLITPSCVEIDEDGDVEVGKYPKKGYGVQDNVFARFKTDMSDNKSYSIKSTGKKINAVQLSAHVLEKMYTDAQKRVQDIKEIVVTIPASFEMAARDNTVKACKKAGFSPKHIINEPTAAAIFYAQKGELKKGKYVVFDLGGGTFDVSIISINSESNIGQGQDDINVLCSQGSPKLGGLDFDDALLEYVKEHYKAKGTPLNPKDYTLVDAEEDKKELSSRKKKQIQINRPDVDDLTITREKFEELISTLTTQIEMYCMAALDEIGLKPSDVSDVLLVGGSTRIPVIQRVAEKVFKKQPKCTSNPDTVVARGAAFFAMYNADDTLLNDTQQGKKEQANISEVSNAYYGTRVQDPYDIHKTLNHIIMKKNQTLPITVKDTLYPIVDGQRAINCSITESKDDTESLEFVNYLTDDKYTLDLGDDSRQDEPINLTYTLDSQQILSATWEYRGEVTKVKLKLK